MLKPEGKQAWRALSGPNPPAPCSPHARRPPAAAEVKNSATRLGYVWQSTGCDSFYWQRVGRKAVKGGGNSVKYMPGGRRASWRYCRCSDARLPPLLPRPRLPLAGGFPGPPDWLPSLGRLPARLPAGAGPAVPQQCPETGAGFQMGGPFWAEPLHDPEWVAGLLDQVRRDKER